MKMRGRAAAWSSLHRDAARAPLISECDTSYRKILATKLDLRLLRLARARHRQIVAPDRLRLLGSARRLRRTRTRRIEILHRWTAGCRTAHDFSHVGFRSKILRVILGDR